MEYPVVHIDARYLALFIRDPSLTAVLELLMRGDGLEGQRCVCLVLLDVLDNLDRCCAFYPAKLTELHHFGPFVFLSVCFVA